MCNNGDPGDLGCHEESTRRMETCNPRKTQILFDKSVKRNMKYIKAYVYRYTRIL